MKKTDILALIAAPFVAPIAPILRVGVALYLAREETKKRAQEQEKWKRLNEEWDLQNGGPEIELRKNFYIG
jgi:hypothetical protein